MGDLNTRNCKPCEGGTKPLTEDKARNLLSQLHQWQITGSQQITRSFTFDSYYQTQAFVNAVAFIAHRQDHHPDISFGYKTATITFTTHAIGGLSENDFICAARVDALLR